MKHSSMGWKSVAPIACVVVLAACASPSPAPVLLTIPTVRVASAASAAAPAPPASGASSAAPILAIRRVAIPEYLVARRVRFRADPSTLAEWPNTYWAERIEIGVTREFTAALRAQLPGWTLCDASCSDQLPSLALQVEMMPMDYLRSAQILKAHARVTVSTGSATPKVLGSAEADYDLPSGGDSAQAQAQAIADLIGRASALAASTVRAAATR